MATVVRCFPKKITPCYRQWANGKIWKLDIGKDFTNITNLRNGLMRHGRGKKIYAEQKGGSLYVQVK